MKAVINAKGELHVYAESGLESYALMQWTKMNVSECAVYKKVIFHSMDDEEQGEQE